jgi:hypothetical protein
VLDIPDLATEKMLPEVSASGAYPLNGKGEGAHSHPLPTQHLSGEGQALRNQICAQDAAGRLETRETQRAGYERPPSVLRGRRGDQGLPETVETHVVWLTGAPLSCQWKCC